MQAGDGGPGPNGIAKAFARWATVGGGPASLAKAFDRWATVGWGPAGLWATVSGDSIGGRLWVGAWRGCQGLRSVGDGGQGPGELAQGLWSCSSSPDKPTAAKTKRRDNTASNDQQLKRPLD